MISMNSKFFLSLIKKISHYYNNHSIKFFLLLNLSLFLISVFATISDIFFPGVFNFLFSGVFILFFASILVIGVLLLLISLTLGKITAPWIVSIVSLLENIIYVIFEKKNIKIFTFKNALVAYSQMIYWLFFVMIGSAFMAGLVLLFPVFIEEGFFGKITSFYFGYIAMIYILMVGSTLAFSILCIIRALINGIMDFAEMIIGKLLKKNP